MLGLRFCARAFSSRGKRGPLLIAVRRRLTIVASLVAEHRLQTHRLSNCGSWAQLLRDMWDLPRPGLEPVSPALAGRFSTTAPPGKPKYIYFKWHYFIYHVSYIICTFGVWLKCKRKRNVTNLGLEIRVLMCKPIAYRPKFLKQQTQVRSWNHIKSCNTHEQF